MKLVQSLVYNPYELIPLIISENMNRIHVFHLSISTTELNFTTSKNKALHHFLVFQN